MLKENGLFTTSVDCGIQKNVPVGLLEKLFTISKVAAGVEAKPDHDMILLFEDPIEASIVKEMVSPKSAQRFNESSREVELVTLAGKPLKPLKTGGTVVHGKIIIWISLMTLPTKTPFLYSDIFIATIPISVVFAVIHKLPELGSKVVVPEIGLATEYPGRNWTFDTEPVPKSYPRGVTKE